MMIPDILLLEKYLECVLINEKRASLTLYMSCKASFLSSDIAVSCLHLRSLIPSILCMTVFLRLQCTYVIVQVLQLNPKRALGMLFSFIN